MTLGQNKKQNNLPNHIAIVMDGNGRWAQKRGLKRKFGHIEGSKTAIKIVHFAFSLGIKYLTLYAFSYENWQRPKHEVDALMDLLDNYLRKNTETLIKNGIKINVIGEIKKLPKKIQESLINAIDDTKNGKKMVLTLALSYSSWAEVINMVKDISIKIKEEKFLLEQITKDLLKKYLYTFDLPDPDLLIRTGYEKRLSNFLLLQLSYTELYFSTTLWPDFNHDNFMQALDSFAKRKRKFGLIKD